MVTSHLLSRQRPTLHHSPARAANIKLAAPIFTPAACRERGIVLHGHLASEASSFEHSRAAQRPCILHFACHKAQHVRMAGLGGNVFPTGAGEEGGEGGAGKVAADHSMPQHDLRGRSEKRPHHAQRRRRLVASVSASCPHADPSVYTCSRSRVDQPTCSCRHVHTLHAVLRSYARLRLGWVAAAWRCFCGYQPCA